MMVPSVTHPAAQGQVTAQGTGMVGGLQGSLVFQLAAGMDCGDFCLPHWLAAAVE